MLVQKSEANAVNSEYQIVKLEKSLPPSGAEGDNWYTYTIERNSSTDIVGNRRGTLEQVSEYARSYVADINSRLANGGHSLWAARKKNKQSPK